MDLYLPLTVSAAWCEDWVADQPLFVGRRCAFAPLPIVHLGPAMTEASWRTSATDAARESLRLCVAQSSRLDATVPAGPPKGVFQSPDARAVNASDRSYRWDSNVIVACVGSLEEWLPPIGPLGSPLAADDATEARCEAALGRGVADAWRPWPTVNANLSLSVVRRPAWGVCVYGVSAFRYEG